MMSKFFENILGLSALILSIVNAIFLLRQYLRDRPNLRITAIYPKDFQWWFDCNFNEGEIQPGRKIGLLVYVGIANRGLRPTTIEDWQLIVKRVNGERVCLSPITIPEPEISFTSLSGNIHTKKYRALGLATNNDSNPLHLPSGYSLSGWAYYVLDGILDNNYTLKEKEGEVTAIFMITDVFGYKAKLKLLLNKVPFEQAKRYIQGIDEITQKV